MSDASADAKRELLLKMLRERAAKAPAPATTAAPAPTPEKVPPLQRIPRSDAMALSFGQERIWTLEQVRPDSRNNILVRFGLRGRLDVESLRRSLESICARHEILRATFPLVDGRPVQRISAPWRWKLESLDLSHLPEAVRAAEERRANVANANMQFDLVRGPLIQSLLIRMAADQHILVVTLHHIISDGWSVDLMCKELAAVYAGFASGKPATLPELPIQYVDFAHWQRSWLTGALLERRRDYWKKKLAGPLPALELPFDRPPSAARSFLGTTRNRFSLDPAVVASLREFSRREGVTLYTTLVTALKVVLHRYSGQDDVVIGTLVAGRERVEVERVMGFFVNTVVLRSDFSGDPTFRAALSRTRTVVLEAQANADFPFDALVAELRPERVANRSPFFDVVFNMQSFDFDSGIPAEGLHIVPLSSLEYFSVADSLTVFVYDYRNQLDVLIVYSPELFDVETIARFESHFTNILRGVASDPDQKLTALPLLSPDERRHLIDLGAGPRVSVPTEHGYARYFEAQVARTPAALAVVDESVRLTYAQLNERANAVAGVLLGHGIEPGEPVAMCSDRSATLLSWILGAFKAGAAYMPLDARFPPGRHAAMLTQSRSRFVLVGQGLEAGIVAATRELPSDYVPHILTAADIEASRGSPENPPPRTDSKALAYIIFTSGSTGTPKGAMVAHRSMLNHFWSKIRGLELGPADVVAQIAPIAFDISLWQFLAVLLAGGCVRIASDEVMREPERLFELIAAEGVTFAHVVPSFLRAFLDGCQGRESQFAGLHRLRSLVLAGEALTPDLVRRWLERWPAVRMVNYYGPSECADETTRQVIDRAPGALELTVPIGRPIDNVRVHVVDRAVSLLPAGVPGELCIAGASVGLGYLNDPERTALSFLKDPYSDDGGWLYRTGDRARMRADGVVEFLGRLDFQVKIRGHRIELGEIEAVLARHPAVRQAVVHPWQSPAGDRLAAYIVPTDPQNVPPTEQLRAHLADVLPSYMTPEDFVVLAQLPLNANGKVNRRALLAPAAATARELVSPRTAMEATIAAIWGAVLKESRIGVHDNFFELGGQSLLAAQVAARLRSELAMDIGVRVLFEKQTLADLARYLELEKERVAAEREEVLL
jgi:amino acid adenylation domain-containing protein